jgi:type II restriction enzyme
VLPDLPEDRNERIRRVASLLPGLTESQLGWLEEIAKQFNRPHTFEFNPDSDIISECLLRGIGDALRLHHCFSKESFTKDKFEYLMERSARICEIDAELAHRGNPGYDITFRGQRFSLKTQANKSISRKSAHISKFMELGSGTWSDNDDDLIGLRKQFFDHMQSYERILMLRTLSKAPANWEYELLEVPKALLELARNGQLEMRHDSPQMPKPGYCHVRNEAGELLFQLYFDGGGERKLQIRNIDITNCIVHARWRFPPKS